MLGTAPLLVQQRLCLSGAGLVARLLTARLQPAPSLTAYAASIMQQRSIQSFFTQTSAATSSKRPPTASTIASTSTLSASGGSVSSLSASSSASLSTPDEHPRVSDVVIDSHVTVSAIDAAPADDALAVSSTATTAPSSPSSSSASPSSSSLPVPTTTAASLDDSVAAPSSAWTTSLSSLLDPSWEPHLRAEFRKPYFARLCASLQSASARSTVYPPAPLIFEAFRLTPFERVSVVILGQDPYHDAGQAEGLAFSVPPPQRPPSSLQNIFKELRTDVGFVVPPHGSLRRWAEQGVLLLNTSLTVTAHAANSHRGFGWETFTDAVIAALNRDAAPGLVFLLWGAHAQKKAIAINTSRHHVLKAAHPSGLSAHRGFFGCRHFSRCNALLLKHGKPEIDWQL